MTELIVGKYEFYPYPKELREPPPTWKNWLNYCERLKPVARRTLKRPRDLLTDADHAVSDVAKCREMLEASDQIIFWQRRRE